MVANSRLGRGREQRLGKLGGLGKAGGQLDAAHSAVLVVGLFARAGQIAAHDALDKNRLGLAHQHGATAQIITILSELLGEICRVDARHVVGQDIGKLIEPEFRNTVQNLTLKGNLIGQDEIESGNTVGSNHQQVVTGIIDIANLAAGIGTKIHRAHESQLLK